MALSLHHYFNKAVLVCIRSLFDDQRPRSYKLVGIGDTGVWLESAELAEAIEAPERTRSAQGTVAAFFPYSHIAYILPETPSAPLAPLPATLVKRPEVKPREHIAAPKQVAPKPPGQKQQPVRAKQRPANPGPGAKRKR